MAAKALEKLNRELDCAVCMNTLKNPKSLSCRHSFCEECLRQCANAAEVRSADIKCPMCREATTLPAEGVAGLKSNPLICRVLDVLEAKKNSTKIACDACGDSESPLTTYCRDCLHFICDSCASSHARMKLLMKDHRPIPLDKIVHGTIQIKWMDEGLWREAYECEEHRGEIRRFYCRTCNKRICRDCIVLDHTKPDHDCTTVPKMFQETQEKLKGRLKSCNEKEKTIQTMLNDVNIKEKEANQKFLTIKENIRERKIKAVENLNKTEKELLSKVEEFEGKFNRKLDAFRGNLKTFTETITKVQLKAKDIISAKEVADLSRGPFLPEDVLKEIEEVIASEVTMTISMDLLPLKGILIHGPKLSKQMSPFATLSLPHIWREVQILPIPDKDIVSISCDCNSVYVASKKGIYKKLLSRDADPTTWMKRNHVNYANITQVFDMAISVKNKTLFFIAESKSGDMQLFRFKMDDFQKSDQPLIQSASVSLVSPCPLNSSSRITVDSQARVVIADNNPKTVHACLKRDEQVKENSKEQTSSLSGFSFGQPIRPTSSASFSFPSPGPTFSFASSNVFQSSPLPPSEPARASKFGVPTPGLARLGQASGTKSSVPFAFGQHCEASAGTFQFNTADSVKKPEMTSKVKEGKTQFRSPILTTSIKIYRGHPPELCVSGKYNPTRVGKDSDNFKVPLDGIRSLAVSKSGQLVFLREDKKAIIITDKDGKVKHEITEPGRMFLSITCTESDALYVLSAFWGSHTVTLTKRSLDDGRLLEYIIDELNVSADFRSDEWPVIGNHGNNLVVINTGKAICVYSAEDWDILDEA